jgi:hypothetical protein
MTATKLTVVAAAALGLMAAGEGPIAYPEGFRAWTHISSGVVGPKSPAAPKYEGVHHIYANAKAMEGYRTGKWPDGAVIVYDQWTAVAAPADSTAQGERKFIDVMAKDSRRFAATGGWGYTEFLGAERRRMTDIEANQAGCDTCHAKSAPGGDRVFSQYRD